MSALISQCKTDADFQAEPVNYQIWCWLIFLRRPLFRFLLSHPSDRFCALPCIACRSRKDLDCVLQDTSQSCFEIPASLLIDGAENANTVSLTPQILISKIHEIPIFHQSRPTLRA